MRRVAALVFHLIGGALVGAGFNCLQRMVQRIGVELGGLFRGGEAAIQHPFGGSTMRWSSALSPSIEIHPRPGRRGWPSVPGWT